MISLSDCCTHMLLSVCNRAITDVCFQKVLDTQSNITYDDIRDTIDDDAVQHWSNCGKLVEM